MIGGGGSGAASAMSGSSSNYTVYTPSPGGSGYIGILVKNVTPGEVLTGIIGAGGTAVSASAGYSTTATVGNAGGATSFCNVTALGGDGGRYLEQYSYQLPLYTRGSQPTSSWISAIDPASPIYGGVPIFGDNINSGYYGKLITSKQPVEVGYYLSKFKDPENLPFCVAGIGTETAKNLPNGNTVSYTTNNSAINAKAYAGTDPGCPGICIYGWSYDNNVNVSSAPGAPGCVAIYEY